MIGTTRLRRLAAGSGYREEIVEKVLYLEAILTRLANHPDADRLLELAPDLLDRRAFRLAFLIHAAGGRRDVRRLRPRANVVTPTEVRRELLPLLRAGSGPLGADPERIALRLNEICTTAIERLLAWTDREREFLDRLCDEGEIVAELITDEPATQALVRDQPLLQWKAQNVKAHRRRER